MRHYQQGGPVVTIEDPNNPGRTIFATVQNGVMTPLRSESGQAFEAASQLEPERAAALIRANEAQARQSQRMMEMMDEMGMKGAISDADIKRLEAMSGINVRPMVETTGIHATMARLRQEFETRPLTSGQMRRMLDAGVDLEEIEAEQIERSYNTTGTGGYIATHANGALEWVPNGPGDVPQPPIGDVFYDPIQEIEREQQMEQLRISAGDFDKLARGGRT